jgi:hypothetical protein
LGGGGAAIAAVGNNAVISAKMPRTAKILVFIIILLVKVNLVYVNRFT